VSAVRAALADAELEPSAVDGFVSYSYDRVGIGALQRALGVPELRLFAEVPYGGAASCGTVAQAAAAIDAGLASCVVCYRAMNGRSGTRLGRAERHLEGDGGALVCRGDRVPAGVFAAPSGLLSPAQTMALWAHRYAHDHALDGDRLSEALGAIAVTQRAYAQTNPRAVTRGKPLSMEDYLAGRMIASPLRIYDLCRENDGAAAVVLTAPRRSARRQPAWLPPRSICFPTPTRYRSIRPISRA
jgi:acetyl-CoA acetyltransferase